MGQYKDFNELWQQVTVMQTPRNYSKEQYEQAQQYCNNFKTHNVGNVHEFFSMYAQISQQPETQDITMMKFWLMGAISDIIKSDQYTKEVHGVMADNGKMSKCDQVHQSLISILKPTQDQTNQPHVIFGKQMISNKFALIFVRLLARDFPDFWPNAFQELFELFSAPEASDEYKMQVIRFVVQVLQTLHQELVEKGEFKTQSDNEVSARVKNGIRQNALECIVQNLGGIVLQNFHQFETRIVTRTLEIFSQLIDWNELALFEGMVQSCFQLLQNEGAQVPQSLKNGAFNCISAVVCKGMDRNQKLDLIQQLNFISMISHFELSRKILDIDAAEDDEARLEEQLFQIISSSVNKLGQWCVEIISSGQQFPQEKQSEFIVVLQALIENGLKLMDTDNPRISMPVIEFFSAYMKHHSKIKDLVGDEKLLNNVSLLTQALIRRFALPDWFIEMKGHTAEPDDWSDGRLDEQKFLRENQMALFGRICNFKPMEGNLLQMIVTLIEQLDPQNSNQNMAEVPLQLMITQSLCLYQSMSQEQKQKVLTDNQNCRALVEFVLNKDMLNQWSCIHSHTFTLEKYIELIYRWSLYFKGEQLCQLILNTYFSEKTLGNMQNTQVVLAACQSLKRTCMQNMPHIISQEVYLKQIVQNCFGAIDGLHKSLYQMGSSQSQAALPTIDCLSSLYNLMGLLAQKISGLDIEITQRATSNLLHALQQAKAQADVNRMTEFVGLIVDFSRGFTTKAEKPELRQCFEKVLAEILSLMKMPGVSNQFALEGQLTKFIERQITLLGEDTKPLIVEITLMQLNQVQNVGDGQVEKLEGVLLLLNNFVGQIKEQSLEVIEQVYADLFQKISLIPVPRQNTSEIQKIQIKVMSEFYRLVQKVFGDYSCAVILTERNFPFIKPFIDLSLAHLEYGFDQNTKRIVWAVLRSLLASFNGISFQQLKLTGLKLKTTSPLFTADCKLSDQDLLNDFNQRLLMMSCEQLFTQNTESFDGANCIRKFSEIHCILLAAGSDHQYRIQQGLVQGLWKLNPVFTEMTKQEVVSKILMMCSEFIENKSGLSKNQSSLSKLNSGYMNLVKELQQMK